MTTTNNLKMKILAIGDTHGKNTWERIVKKEHDADKIVFIGDYFDSFDIHFETQLENFKNLLEYKKQNPEKVVLLFGNHDFHYIYNEQYSGYQSFHNVVIRPLMEEAIKNDLIQMCYQWGEYIFTHAGITNTWATENAVESFNKPVRELNAMLKNYLDAFKFTPSNPLDRDGSSVTQSPIWVRPDRLIADPFRGYDPIIQVVGHTKMKTIIIDPAFIFIDVLDSCDEYLIIEDGKPRKGTV